MTEVLDRSASVALYASGAAMTSMGPAKYRETWKITRITTDGASAIEPVLDVYRGAAGGRLVDTTRRGNAAVSETDLELRAGERVTFVYSAGSPGAILTVHIEGTVSYGISG